MRAVLLIGLLLSATLLADAAEAETVANPVATIAYPEGRVIRNVRAEWVRWDDNGGLLERTTLDVDAVIALKRTWLQKVDKCSVRLFEFELSIRRLTHIRYAATESEPWHCFSTEVSYLQNPEVCLEVHPFFAVASTPWQIVVDRFGRLHGDDQTRPTTEWANLSPEKLALLKTADACLLRASSLIFSDPDIVNKIICDLPLNIPTIGEVGQVPFKIGHTTTKGADDKSHHTLQREAGRLVANTIVHDSKVDVVIDAWWPEENALLCTLDETIFCLGPNGQPRFAYSLILRTYPDPDSRKPDVVIPRSPEF